MAADARVAPPFDWEAAGRELGATLERLNAIAVLGHNDADTARVALGIARSQTRKRRVAVGDLLGDAAPFEALVPSDDPHGLSDVFEYGVSISRIARQVPGEDNLSILPTGAFLTDLSEIMAHRRWSALATTFREDGGLLIIAAHASSPDVETLVVQLDGAVLVGEMVPARLPLARILGSVGGSLPVSVPAHPEPKPPQYVIRQPKSRWRAGAIGGGFLALVIAAIGVWLASRPYVEGRFRVRGFGKRSGIPALDSAQADSIRKVDSVRAVEKAMGLATKEDSANVAPFAITFVTFNTEAGALLELQRFGATLRAGTFTPILIRETTWFRVIAGAYPDSASAAALLDTLRAQGMGDAGRGARGTVERYPYALLVERDVPDTAVASRVSSFQTRGLPVYALLQSDRTARLYAGAFKTPEEANLLTEQLRTAGVHTSVVYRTGRVY